MFFLRVETRGWPPIFETLGTTPRVGGPFASNEGVFVRVLFLRRALDPALLGDRISPRFESQRENHKV